MRLHLAVLGCVLLGGCAARDPVGSAISRGAVIYPAGTLRDELSIGPDVQRVAVTTDQRTGDAFAKAVMARQAEIGARPPTAYLVNHLIQFRSSNPASYGLSGDYIFLDESDRVLYAARRHLD